MIPPFDSRGNLPPGVHLASWEEICGRFGTTPHRRILLKGMSEALLQFRLAGCPRAYIDGSFATADPTPADYDVCYEMRGMDPMYLDAVFFDMRASRAAQKIKYGGEFFPCSLRALSGYNFLQFFQVDKNTGQAKGIIGLDLEKMP